ncbi:MAG TPA: histidine kinase, partial [Cellvibrio sp.]
IFWNPLTSAASAAGGNSKLLQHIASMVVSNGFVTQLVICAWISMYIGVTSNKRSKETELINLRLQNSLREAQLSSLANQLNPHFLFNALNNIRFMIHETPDRADRMITELSEMLRYSLQTSKKDKVPLLDETAMIERYIDIVKIQLEERLQFSMHIPHQMNDYWVPPMMLQMLVENAVKHGIDNLQQGGRLHIIGEEEAQHIVFEITNDSAIAENKLQTNMGIGLTNIKQRLKLLYGDQAALNVTEEKGQFSVRVRLPKDTHL